MDVHAHTGLYYPSFSRSFDGTKDNDLYLRTILFLDALLQHYSTNNVLPKYLVHDLASGCFYAGLARHQWVIHFRKAQASLQHPSDQRTYITEDRLSRIQEINAQSYVEMTDDQLQLAIYTVQQLLVEHALFLLGPMFSSHVRAAHATLQYYQPPLLRYHSDFLGFNTQDFHSNLLKFVYHQNGGILSAPDGFSTYSAVFLTQLESSTTPLVHASMLPWMRWMRQVLGNVVRIIGTYCSQYLVNYLIEDRNRVSFLAFEFVLRHLDALTLPVIDNWDKALLLELRLVFVTYHTNISYPTGIRTIFPSDQQLSTFVFDRSPDSLQSPLLHHLLRHLRVEHLPRQSLMMSISGNFNCYGRRLKR